MKTIALALALLAFQESRPTSRPTSTVDRPLPAIVEDLKVPSLKRDGVEDPPHDGVIARNAGVADRFTAEGMSVAYTFEARAGDVSLFQLTSWGFARGWQSTATIRVVDDAGVELVSRTRTGGARYELFLNFEAPREGAFHCELHATKEFYRYTLVRHSNFAAEYGKRIELREANHTHAFLSDSAARVVFEVQLQAGQDASFMALNADPRARKAISASRASAAIMAQAPTAVEADWPALALRILGEPETHENISHYRSFTPETTGTYLIEVFSQSRSEGGIFELSVNRGIDRHATHGRIANHSAQAAADVALRFYREPNFELIATAVTDSTGHYETELPSGPYTVTMRGNCQALTSFRTNVLRPRELNAIYAGTRSEAPTSRPTTR